MSVRHVVQLSGGVTSWWVGRIVAERHGAENTTLLCANTNSEAADWLPFVEACARDIGAQLVMLDNEGRTTWDVFRHKRFIGNSRIDPCSMYLKRVPLRRWLEENCDPESTVVYLGYDWTEPHRAERAMRYWAPWRVEFPLTEGTHPDKDELIARLPAYGIPIPWAYIAGFEHNNCGGACVKAGKRQWLHLLARDRQRYLAEEAQEEAFRAEIGKKVTILKESRGGVSVPVTLRELRERAEAATITSLLDEFGDDDNGACSCATPAEGSATAAGEVAVVIGSGWAS